MQMPEKLNLTIRLNDIKLMYPSVFEKNTYPFQNTKPRYQGSFDYSGEIEGIERKGDPKYYRYSGFQKPTVRPLLSDSFSEYEELARVIQIAKNCNFRLDGLLHKMVVDASFRVYEYDVNGHSGMGMALLGIFITPENLITHLTKKAEI